MAKGEGGGPKTPEGKAISSMNALKHGRYMRNYQRIGQLAGKLAICDPCGKSQQRACAAASSCALQNELILNYHYAQAEKDLQRLEQNNAIQLASMDLIFSQKLRWAMQHLGEIEIVRIKGAKMKQPVVREEHIRTLLDMMTALSKTLPDMQLTRRTQENIDVEWAKLLEAEITQEKADEYKQRALQSLNEWKLKALEEADEMKEKDAAIQEFVNKGKNEKDEKPLQIGKIGRSPFGHESAK